MSQNKRANRKPNRDSSDPTGFLTNASAASTPTAGIGGTSPPPNELLAQPPRPRHSAENSKAASQPSEAPKPKLKTLHPLVGTSKEKEAITRVALNGDVSSRRAKKFMERLPTSAAYCQTTEVGRIDENEILDASMQDLFSLGESDQELLAGLGVEEMETLANQMGSWGHMTPDSLAAGLDGIRSGSGVSQGAEPKDASDALNTECSRSA